DHVDAVIEVVGAEIHLLERVVAVTRVARDLVVVEWTQAIVRAYDGTEVLEAGATERWIPCEEEVPSPVALARDGSVGLRVHGQEQTSGLRRLCQPADEDQRVSV